MTRESDLREGEEVPPSSVVIRFTPSSAEKVLDRASICHEGKGSDAEPRMFSSVYVDRRPDVPRKEAIDHLLGVASLKMNPATNKHYFVTTAGALLDENFSFKKDRYPDEEIEHYSVDLGVEANLETAARFLSVFEKDKTEGRWPS